MCGNKPPSLRTDYSYLTPITKEYRPRHRGTPSLLVCLLLDSGPVPPETFVRLNLN